MPFIVLVLQRVDLEDDPDTDKQLLDGGQAMNSTPLTPAQRSKILKALPPDVAAAAQAAIDSLANADAQVWALQHACMGWQTCLWVGRPASADLSYKADSGHFSSLQADCPASTL